MQNTLRYSDLDKLESGKSVLHSEKYGKVTYVGFLKSGHVLFDKGDDQVLSIADTTFDLSGFKEVHEPFERVFYTTSIDAELLRGNTHVIPSLTMFKGENSYRVEVKVSEVI